MKGSLTDKMVIANVSGFIYGVSIQLQRREPELAKILLDKCERLDLYLESVSTKQSEVVK